MPASDALSEQFRKKRFPIYTIWHGVAGPSYLQGDTGDDAGDMGDAGDAGDFGGGGDGGGGEA
jgi:hypothetical protein